MKYISKFDSEKFETGCNELISELRKDVENFQKKVAQLFSRI